MRTIHKILVLTLMVTLPAIASHAQSEDSPDPGQMALSFSNSMKANAKTLAGYTWKNTLEIKEEGATVSKTINQVRITSDGTPEMTLVSQEPAQEEKKGLRGKKQDKQAEYIESIVKMAVAYTMPATGDLVEFFEHSTFALGAGNLDGYIQVQGKGLVQDGDEVTMWIHGTTYQPYKTEFRTKLDGDTVAGTVTYGHVGDGGPFYLAKQITTVESKKLEAIVQNSDHAAVK